jgi:hypothetical protein
MLNIEALRDLCRTATEKDPATPKKHLKVRLDPAEYDSRMPDEEWIKTLADGRRVKFTIQELPDDGVFITAQIEGNEVVYSIVLTTGKNPLSCGDVEKHFEGELSKK